MDVFQLPVFPAADVFPMMADDELEEMAADIKENGLREPVVVANVDVADKDTGEVSSIAMLVDGRNRRAACKIAGVKPDIRKLNGEDPSLFVLSANINRRHMNAGQRAMTTICVLKNNKTNNKIRQKLAAINGNTSQAYISMALAVHDKSPDLVPPVISGAMKLADAYQETLKREREAETEDAKIAKLKESHPTLARKVEDGELTLRAALVEAEELDNRTAESKKTHRAVCKAALFNVGAFAADKHAEGAHKNISLDEYLQEYNIDRKEFARQVKAFKQGVPRLIELLDSLLETKK